LGIDEEKIKKQIEIQHEKIIQKDPSFVNEYLEKIIQISIQIPKPKDIELYIETLLITSNTSQEPSENNSQEPEPTPVQEPSENNSQEPEPTPGQKPSENNSQEPEPTPG
ncbi:P-loop NTPase fold protein, partial [Ardenticatena maritima]